MENSCYKNGECQQVGGRLGEQAGIRFPCLEQNSEMFQNFLMMLGVIIY